MVSDAYPTYSCKFADLILPAAMIFEKWGLYGNAERRTQGWAQKAVPPGQARTDLWMMMEFAKRIQLKDVWGEQSVPGLKSEGFPDGKLPDILKELRLWLQAGNNVVRSSLCPSGKRQG